MNAVNVFETFKVWNEKCVICHCIDKLSVKKINLFDKVIMKDYQCLLN